MAKKGKIVGVDSTERVVGVVHTGRVVGMTARTLV